MEEMVMEGRQRNGVKGPNSTERESLGTGLLMCVCNMSWLNGSNTVFEICWSIADYVRTNILSFEAADCRALATSTHGFICAQSKAVFP